MRVVVVGATGNVGTSLLRVLGADERVTSVLGIARRLPEARLAKVRWAAADIAHDELAPHFTGADCVVHLAWLIQPSRDQELLWRVNVEGSSRLFAAARDSGVRSVVYASSIGVYSPGPKDTLVDESWPRDGVRTNYYSRQKAEVERRLDAFEHESPDVRVVRMRPSFIFKRESASGQRRLFAGPFLPTPLLRSSFFPVVPDVPRLRFQALHADDVAEAYRAAIVGASQGAFNLAAEPVLDMKLIAREIGARTVPVPGRVLRAATAVAWRLRLVPSDEGWIDAGLQSPLLDASRARRELGWEPRWSGLEAAREAVLGMREGAGGPTPPLEPGHTIDELKTGVGASDR